MKKRAKGLFKKHKTLIKICITSLILFIILLFDLLVTKQITKLDYLIYGNIPSIQQPLLTRIFIIITSFGSTIPLIIFTAILSIFLIIKKKYSHLILLLLSMALGLIIELGIKQLVHRLRPELQLVNANLFSFPSGHATMALIFFTILLYSMIENIKNKKAKLTKAITTLIIILLIGFSRIYLGVHWLSDVLGGFLLGIFITSFCLLILEIIYNKN